MKAGIRDLDPATLNFVGGLGAGVGINLLTTVATCEGTSTTAAKLLFLGLPWLIFAIAIWRASMLLERARAQLVATPTSLLGPAEIDAYIETKFQAVRTPVRRALWLAGAFILIVALSTLYYAIPSKSRLPAKQAVAPTSEAAPPPAGDVYVKAKKP